jgi:hypothetical protein
VFQFKMRLLLVFLSLIFSSLPSLVLAASARVVYSSDAARGLTLKVWAGYGLSISFLENRGIIKQVWLGNPGLFAVSSDGVLCPQLGTNSQSCNNAGARVIFLRTITPVNIPGLPPSPDGSTQITLLVHEPTGEKQYQFRLVPAKGIPEYTSLSIRADTEKPRPLFRSPDRKIRPFFPQIEASTDIKDFNVNVPKKLSDRSSQISKTEDYKVSSSQQVEFSATVNTPPSKRRTSTESRSSISKLALSQSIDDANAVAFGLSIAARKKQISPRTSTWKKVQNAIILLRRGASRTLAAQKAGLDISLLEQLISWGQNRP